MLLAQLVAVQRRQVHRLLLSGVQLRNATQRLLGHGATAGSVDVEELAPNVSQASEFGWASRKQCLVACVIVDHQMAAPVLQERTDVCPGATGRVIEDDDARPLIERIGAASPQIGMFGLAAARIELAHRCFIGRQATSFPENSPRRSASGCKATPMRPIHSPSVERASGTTSRAAICSIRYSGK